MELYLIRHAIAVERGIYEQDEQRPLTPKGIQKMTLVAQKLQKMGLKFEAIFTSPLVRAFQTAQILQEAGLSDLLETDMSLAPDGNLRNWLRGWQKSQYNQEESKLALVGHQPNLGQWTEELVWGGVNNHIIVKKAGIIGIKLPVQDDPIGNSELFLLTTPKWLIY